MYTILPTNRKEFETMAEARMDAWTGRKLTDEMIFRINLDLNLLFKESELEFIDWDHHKIVTGYRIKRSKDKEDYLVVEPRWAELK